MKKAKTTKKKIDIPRIGPDLPDTEEVMCILAVAIEGMLQSWNLWNVEGIGLLEGLKKVILAGYDEADLKKIHKIISEMEDHEQPQRN